MIAYKKMFAWTFPLVSLVLLACEPSGGGSAPVTTSNASKATANFGYEVAFTTGNYQGIGIAVAKDNRFFVTFPKWGGGAFQYALAEVQADGSLRAYPNAALNTFWNETSPQKDFNNFVSVQNVIVDTQNNLWVLDSAIVELTGSIREGVKLVKINLNTNQVERTYRFPESVVPVKAMLNDLRIDEKRNMMYMADPVNNAIIVLNLANGQSKRVLHRHTSVVQDPSYVVRMGDGNPVINRTTGEPFSSGVNGIAITKDFEYFYYRPETDVRLFRIKSEHLANWQLSDTQLATFVEDLGVIGYCNGMETDSKGNLYISDALTNSIKRRAPDGTITTIAQGAEVLWPDTFTISSDEKSLFVSASQLPQVPTFNAGKDDAIKPFKILKINLTQN